MGFWTGLISAGGALLGKAAGWVSKGVKAASTLLSGAVNLFSGGSGSGGSSSSGDSYDSSVGSGGGCAADDSARGEFEREQLRNNQEFQREMLKARQDFDLKLNKRNAKLQRELAKRNHDYRLEEQEQSFNRQKDLANYKAFLDKWPMLLPVEMLREEHQQGDFVTMGVFLFKNRDRIDSEADRFWDMNIYPLVEDDLNEWVENVYRNGFDIDNIKFYRDSFRDENAHHGSLVDIVRYALRGLPTVILESNVLPYEVRLSFTIWGLGDDSTKRYRRYTFRKRTCEVKTENGLMSREECRGLADWICSCFKMIVGCNFDAFRLAQYNQMPIFPEIAKEEAESGVSGTPLLDEDLRKEFGVFYAGLYELLLGPDSGFVKDCVNNKLANAYRLRLDYAKTLKEFADEECLNKWLSDSVEAWCALRGEKPAREWLGELLAGRYSRYQYFDSDDEAYFKEIAELMSESSLLKPLCDKTVRLLNAAESAEDLFREGRRLYASEGEADRKQALSLCRRAAEMGLAEAQVFLGDRLIKGEGTAENKEEAVSWFRKAAERGNAAGQYKLGLCYVDGDGVKADKEEAKKWLTLAAEQGHREAEKRLAELKDPTVELRAVYTDKQVGERFEFGRYPQGENGEVQPINWRVLRRDKDALLVISEYGLDAKPYHKDRCSITWSDCTLRGWLNGEFLQKAFTTAEQSLIRTSRLANNAGPETDDRMYLLSMDEANGLFADDNDHKTKPSAYAVINGAWTCDDNRWKGNAWWWLRSRRYDSNAAGVNADGYINHYSVYNASAAVRPAFRIAI
ncbi:sel1 repeat family protein [bacterium]|nr:sel1 repeat family protein [bacterium]